MNYCCEYITQNGQTTTLTYLSSPDGLYGLHRILPDGSENIHYLHTDHLGSWTAVTDETGTVVDEQSYDAWGNRRSPYTWRKTGLWQTPRYDRGFTGHEHLDGFQLINMNGRMYDPVVSRMLAPDNFVQTPDFSQNFNRYSYALNNPLMFTDPDGEFIHLIIGAAIGGIANWIFNGAQFNAAGLGHFGVGALAGGLGAGIGAGVGAALAGNAAAGGGFAAGFVGTNTITSSGFVAGAVSGASAGFTNGLVSGTGNGIISGKKFEDAFAQGFNSAWQQGIGGGLAGGVIGGLTAIHNKRNFWSGHDQGSGRSLFAFNNTDKSHTHYRTRSGYELIDNIERKGSQWVKSYDDRVHWGTGEGISNGAISRRDNYLLPWDDEINLTLDSFKGRSTINFHGHIPDNTSIQISFDGNIISTLGTGKTQGVFMIPANVNNVNIKYIIPFDYLRDGVISPWRTTITGYLR